MSDNAPAKRPRLSLPPSPMPEPPRVVDEATMGGPNRREFLPVAECLVDAFAYLNRDTLAAAQLVCQRFNAVILQQFSDKCLRFFHSAQVWNGDIVSYRSHGPHYSLRLQADPGMYGYQVKCAKPYDDLSTVQLLMAYCRASRVDLMYFGGLAAPLRDVVLQSIIRHAPLVDVRKLDFDGLPLAADVPNDRFLTTLKSFAEINVLVPPKARTPEEKASVENFCKNRGIHLENALYYL